MACCIIAVSGDRTRGAQPREEGSDEEEKNRELRVAIYNVWKGDVVRRSPAGRGRLVMSSSERRRARDAVRIEMAFPSIWARDPFHPITAITCLVPTEFRLCHSSETWDPLSIQRASSYQWWRILEPAMEGSKDFGVGHDATVPKCLDAYLFYDISLAGFESRSWFWEGMRMGQRDVTLRRCRRMMCGDWPKKVRYLRMSWCDGCGLLGHGG
ncbi:hypothetical protein B296_00027516 [Ensete ventricosum]|uniref:Uncharacterized protein n=1 Tax=Ensete ventricosum TaxID=4639 RepID=A0A427AJQ8_ENSVE|nr:hypothetical protein B296_00027516 [Ensete ventricosum]